MIDRTREMIKLKQEGMTYREIGKRFGVSHQRVAQIIGEQNVSYFKKVTEKQCGAEHGWWGYRRTEYKKHIDGKEIQNIIFDELGE